MLEPVLLSPLHPFLSLSFSLSFSLQHSHYSLQSNKSKENSTFSAMAVVSSSSSYSMWVFFFLLLALFIHLQAAMATTTTTTTPQISHLRSQRKCFTVRSFFSMCCSVMGWFSFSFSHIVWISKPKQCSLLLSHPHKKLRVIWVATRLYTLSGCFFKQCAISDVKTVQVGFTTVIQVLTRNQRKLNTLENLNSTFQVEHSFSFSFIGLIFIFFVKTERKRRSCSEPFFRFCFDYIGMLKWKNTGCRACRTRQWRKG